MGNPLPPRPVNVIQWSPTASLSHVYKAIEETRHTEAVAALRGARSWYTRDYEATARCFPPGHAPLSLAYLSSHVETFFITQETIETTRHALSISTINMLNPDRWSVNESLFTGLIESETHRHSYAISVLMNKRLELSCDCVVVLANISETTPAVPLHLLEIHLSGFNSSLAVLEQYHHNSVEAIIHYFANTELGGMVDAR
jgi:hypothetical protein